MHARQREEQRRVEHLAAPRPRSRSPSAQRARRRARTSLMTPPPHCRRSLIPLAAGPCTSGSLAISRPSCRMTRAIEHRSADVEIVRGQQHDAARRAQLAQPFDQRHGRGIVEAGERLVEQHQPRLVQQRALERQPLPHAAREPRHEVVRRDRPAARGRSASARRVARHRRGRRARPKNARFSRAVSSGYRCSSCDEHADARAQRRRRSRCAVRPP